MPITIALTGDAIAARRIVGRRDDATTAVRAVVADADIAFTNLEIVLNTFHGPASDWFNLSAEPAIATDLRAYGFDVVSVANNHALNYGIPGIRATLDALRRAGLPGAGIGRDLAAARRAAWVESPAGRVALLATSSTFVPGQQATPGTRGRHGRAGLSPLRFQQTHVVDRQAIDTLRRLADQLGVGHPHRALVTRGGDVDLDDPNVASFLGARFRAGDEPVRTESVADAEDLAAILDGVRDARWSADIVMVSVHCHEPGVDRYHPPAFLVEFARACIDAGADVVIGHGPHRLRGIEVYRGKPIFYSLANFIYEPEYVDSLPGERYLRPEMRDWTPARFHAQFQRDAEEFESVVALCRFDAGSLAGIDLVPIDLSGPMPGRGVPRLADGETARRVLARLAALSTPFGTVLTIENGRGTVRLDPDGS